MIGNDFLLSFEIFLGNSVISDVIQLWNVKMIRDATKNIDFKSGSIQNSNCFVKYS